MQGRCTAQVCPEPEPRQRLRADPSPVALRLLLGAVPVPSFYLQIQLLSSCTTSSPCTLPPPLLTPAKVPSAPEPLHLWLPLLPALVLGFQLISMSCSMVTRPDEGSGPLSRSLRHAARFPL